MNNNLSTEIDSLHIYTLVYISAEHNIQLILQNSRVQVNLTFILYCIVRDDVPFLQNTFYVLIQEANLPSKLADWLHCVCKSDIIKRIYIANSNAKMKLIVPCRGCGDDWCVLTGTESWPLL